MDELLRDYMIIFIIVVCVMMLAIAFLVFHCTYLFNAYNKYKNDYERLLLDVEIHKYHEEREKEILYNNEQAPVITRFFNYLEVFCKKYNLDMDTEFVPKAYIIRLSSIDRPTCYARFVVATSEANNLDKWLECAKLLITRAKRELNLEENE